MNSFVWFLASGDSLYIGAVFLAIAIVSMPRSHSRLRWVLRIFRWMALSLMVLATPPFPWIVDGVFFALFLTWVVACGRQGSTQKQSMAASVALFLVLSALVGAELPHRFMPRIVAPTASMAKTAKAPGCQIAVIGDSISAGLDANIKTWPVIFQENTGLRVRNLSLAGATTEDGKAMVQSLLPEDSVLIIELGGNDVLSGVSSSLFARNLEAILSRAAMPGRIVVMFELPLLPHQVAFGQVQRNLATRYHVFLIPKRFFTSVLGRRGATVDGLHLSSAGSQQMANIIMLSLAPVFNAARCGTRQIRLPAQ